MPRETSQRAPKEDSYSEEEYTHIYRNDKFSMSAETENVFVQWFYIKRNRRYFYKIYTEKQLSKISKNVGELGV
jgi:hypothetical protein